MIIGSFVYDGEKNVYAGDIITLGITLQNVMFMPNSKRNQHEPDYRIVVSGMAEYVELGAGWKRSSERGQSYVSVALDSPVLPAPIHAALFAGKDEAHADLVWNCRKPAKEDETDD